MPSRLSLDTFEGTCFVGAVAFSMCNVRPWIRGPIMPGGTSFGEINLRTYVHVDGAEPGVFFFSLDAANPLIVLAARALWGLPYHYAEVKVQDEGTQLGFESRRRRTGVAFSAHARIGPRLPLPPPSSLEFFLCERYQFYAEVRGRLRRARVHHAPYTLHAAKPARVDDSLLKAAGLPTHGARTPDFFSPGVDADVFALEHVVPACTPSRSGSE